MSAKRTDNKLAVLVLDGFGLDPAKEWEIAAETWRRLPAELTGHLDALQSDPRLSIAALAPTSHGVARKLADETGEDWEGLFTRIKATQQVFRTELGHLKFSAVVDEIRRKVACELHYVPWSVQTSFLFALRQQNPTWITRTAGVYTGFEDLTPEIMGNSDTGHQQIFNLTVARQIPAFISHLVETGAFFENEQLNLDLRAAAQSGVVVFKTLLSGEFGDDGYVHSAWKHMVAFFKLYFDVLGLPAQKLQIEAVLDGRDSPSYSSLRKGEKDGVERYGFLHKLRDLLKGYGAEECLTWIIGRQFMDRDYKGAMIRNEYELVTANRGRKVADIDAAFALIASDHESGQTDPMVKPMVIGDPQPLDGRSLLFNAIFRADRQEPITAALLGFKQFIERQATQKKRLDTWEGFGWIQQHPGLKLWAMIDYHDAFIEKGASCVYKDSPHQHNVLHLINRSVEDFRLLFLTEGVKEKHMGLFSRGRRSTPLVPAETQVIIATHGKEQGVESDNDLYKVPQMRHPEIAERLVQELDKDNYQLIAVNFPGADMIGHLVENHFDACGQTLLSLEAALDRIVPIAKRNGWTLVVTADHGNVDHWGPDHGNHDVLTSLVIPSSVPLVASPPPLHQARLFDIAWTILSTFGLTPDDVDAPPIPEELSSDPRRLVGTPLVT